MGAGRDSFGGLEMAINARAISATGILIQKIARQVHSIRYPPAIGPIAVRPPAMPKNSASARPRERRSKVTTTMAIAAGNMIAPPAPCTARNATSHASAAPPRGVSAAQRRRAGEDDHPEHDHPAVPGDVGQAAAEGEQRRQRQQVGVDRPLHAAGRQAQVMLDRRRGDRDDRLVDERHGDREDHRGQDQASRLATGGTADAHCVSPIRGRGRLRSGPGAHGAGDRGARKPLARR